MTEAEPKIIRESLANLLARREHSQAELRLKMQQREFDATVVEKVIADFAERGLQSDARFASSFVRQRYGKGHGAMRIRAELRQKKVSDPLIEAALAELDADWFEAARDAYIKKYVKPAADWKEQQKRARHLQYRGFTQEQIRYAMGTETES